VRYDLSEVEASSSGEVLLPLQRLSAILREVSEDAVAIEAAEDALRVKCGHSDFRLSVSDPAEFPDVPMFSGAQHFAVPASVLRQAIQRTLFAADVESTRYALGGVLLDFSDQGLTLAATDSRRLAVCPIACTAQGGAAGGVQPVVPSKAMSMIERSLASGDDEVRIAVNPHDVIVQSGPATIYARLVQGRFPRYQDVVPRDSRVQIELVVGPLHSAVRQAMIVTNDESRGVDFRFENGTLTLESQAADVGASKVDLPVSYDGECILVTFDPKFVADFLRVLEPSAAVTLHLTDSNSAAVFRADENYTYVVMPLAPDR
jgi:DNA polymerase-3 subunit beta